MRPYLKGLHFFAVFLLSFFITTLLTAKEVVLPPIQQVYSHFLNAILLERQGQWTRALEEYTQTLALEPEATLIYRHRSNLHLKMGDAKKALDDAKIYLQSHPEDINARLQLSNIYFILADTSTARSVLENVLKQNPDHSDTFMFLGSLILNEDPKEAVKIYEQYIRLNPDSADGHYNLGVAYQKIGNQDRARTMYEKVIELDPDSLQALMLLGQFSEENSDSDHAIGYFSKALQKIPENFNLRMKLVALNFQRKNYNAMESLLASYKNDPDAPNEVHLWLGLIYEKKKEPKEALKYYRRIRNAESSPDLYFRMANIYTELGQYKKALKTIQTLAERDPNNPQYHYFLGLAYLQMEKSSKAIQEFRRAIELNPQYSQAYFQMGMLLDSLKQWDKAEKLFLEAIRHDPNNASAHNYLGYTYADRNEKLFEARKHIEKALELDQENPAYLDSLGWLNFREGHLKEALFHLKTAAERLPDPEVFDHMGDCYQVLGQISESAQSYQNALSLAPKNKKIREKLKKFETFLVPTNPAMVPWSNFKKAYHSNFQLSGVVVLKIRTGPANLIPAGHAYGFFKFETNKNRTDSFSQISIDFANPFPLPATTLNYKNGSKPAWHVFPPELKNQFAPETESLLQSIVSFFDAGFVRDFDQRQTQVYKKWSYYVLKNGENSLHLDKKNARILELNTPGIRIKIKKFKKSGIYWIPEKMRLEWAVSHNGKKKWLAMDLTFSQMSAEP